MEERYPLLPEKCRKSLKVLLSRFNVDIDFEELYNLLVEFKQLISKYGEGFVKSESAFPDVKNLVDIALEYVTEDSRTLLGSVAGNILGEYKTDKRYIPVGPFFYRMDKGELDPYLRFMVWVYFEKCISIKGLDDDWRQSTAEQLILAASSARGINPRWEMIQNLSENIPRNRINKGEFARVVNEWSDKKIFNKSTQVDFRRALIRLFTDVTKNRGRGKTGPTVKGPNTGLGPSIKLPPEGDDVDGHLTDEMTLELIKKEKTDDEGLPSNYWLSDCIEATTGLYRRWNDMEKQILFDCWKEDFQKYPDYKGELGFMLLILLTGRGPEYWEERRIGEIGCIDTNGFYNLPIDKPEDGISLLKEFEEKLLPMATNIKLPLPSLLTKILMECGLSERKGERLTSLTGKKYDDLVVSITGRLHRWRKNTGMQFWLPRLSAQLPIELSIITKNTLLVYLLTSSEKHRWPISMYYQAMRVRDVQAAWREVIRKLMPGATPEEMTFSDNQYLEDIRTGIKLKEDVEREFVDKLIAHTKEELKNTKDFVAFHNTFTLYVVSLLLWASAHRPVRDPFSRFSEMYIEAGLALIDDKSRFANGDFRLGAVCNTAGEQVLEYGKHLLWLAKALKNRGRKYHKIAKTIYQLAQNVDNVGIPYFFLLDASGTHTISITEKSIETHWKTFLKGMPANYGRYFLFASLSDAYVPYDWIEAIMGHRIGTEHVFGESSEYIPVEVMGYLRGYIESAISGVGWSVIPAKTSYKVSESFSQINIKTIESGIHEEALLGSAFRVKQRKRERKAFNDAIGSLISDFMMERHNARRPIGEWSNEDLRELFRTVNNDKKQNTAVKTHIRKIIARIIRSASRSRLDVDKLPDRFDIRDERSPFKDNYLVNFKAAKDAQCQFHEYLGKQGDFNKVKTVSLARRLAEITASAALYGGIFNRALLENIPESVENRMTRYKNEIHVLISQYQNGDKGMSPLPLFRWILDLTSHRLCVGYSSLDKESGFNRVNYDNELKRIATILGWNKSSQKDVMQWFSDLAATLMIMNSPGFLVSAQKGSVLPSLSSSGSWSQINAGFRRGFPLPAYAEAKPLALKPGEESASSKQFRNEIRQVFNAVIKNIEAGELPSEKGRMDFLSMELLKAFNEQKNWTICQQLIAAWLIHISKYGTPRREKPAVTTPLRYFYRISKPLLAVVGSNEGFLRLDSSEYMEIYQNAANKSNDNLKSKVYEVLEYFHGFVVKNYHCSPVVFPRRPDSAIKVASTYASWLTESEYLDTLDWILRDTRLNEQQRLIVCGLLILIYRFGLRVSEAKHLPNSGLYINRKLRICFLCITRTEVIRHKSNSGVRKIKTEETLSDIEWQLLDRIKRAGERSYYPKNQLLLTMSSSVQAKDLDTAEEYLQSCLKYVTGERQLSCHSLRHGYANRLFSIAFPDPEAEVSACDPSQPYETATADVPEFALNGYRGSRYLKAIGHVMGHSTSKETLLWYIHRHDELTHRYAYQLTNEMSVLAKSYATQVKYSTLKKRMGSDDSASDIGSEIINIPSWLIEHKEISKPRNDDEENLPRFKSRRVLPSEILYILCDLDRFEGDVNAVVSISTVPDRLVQSCFTASSAFQARWNYNILRLSRYNPDSLLQASSLSDVQSKIRDSTIKRVSAWFRYQEKQNMFQTEHAYSLAKQFFELASGRYQKDINSLLINTWDDWSKMILSLKRLGLQMESIEILVSEGFNDIDKLRKRCINAGIAPSSIKTQLTTREAKSLARSKMALGFQFLGSDIMKYRLDFPLFFVTLYTWFYVVAEDASE